LVIGSPEEVSGCFLTKLEVGWLRQRGFRKPQTTHRGQKKRYNYSRSNAIGKYARRGKIFATACAKSREPRNDV